METLHEAIVRILSEAGREGLPVAEITRLVRERDLYRTRAGTPPAHQQIHARISNYSSLFEQVPGSKPMRIRLKSSRNASTGVQDQRQQKQTVRIPLGQSQKDWFWEGNIQAQLARYLQKSGWEIREFADTAARAQGADLFAVRDGQALVIETKGYPSDRYASGPRAGERKPTHPTLQARHWFAGALLSVLLAQVKRPGARVAIGLPDFPRYRSLLVTMKRSLRHMGIGVYLIDRHGEVHVELEPGEDSRSAEAYERKLAELLVALRRLLEGLYGPRLRGVFAYGSQVRGEQQVGSDVDIIVVLDSVEDYGVEIDRSGEIVADLSLQFGVSISRVFVSEKEWAEATSAFVFTAREEAVAI